jgi:hypothetical protein
MTNIEAERIRSYADKLGEQQCTQPAIKMVVVTMMRHIADAIEGKDPPETWRQVK